MIDVDFYNMIVRERGAPDGWRWFSLKVLGDPRGPREHGALQCEGAVPGETYKSGKRKGEINWTKATGRSTHVITFRDLDERMLRWERDEQRCHKCGGDGQELAGHSVTEGTRTRTCSRCGGTGKPKAQP